jgi:acyl dehydratase
MGIAYDDFEIGQELEGSATLTETHIYVSAGLFNDFNPLHVNDAAARKGPFGRRLVHGPTVLGIMQGTIGNAVSGTGVGILEVLFRFRAAVLVGDTISYVWRVVAKDDKPKHNGGIVTFEGICRNEEGTVVIEATDKVLVSDGRLG